MPKTGNELLYLLSDKKQLTYSKFKQYISSYDVYLPYNLLRDFSAINYLDIDNSKRNIIVRVIPPMLIELSSTEKTYLLSGARSPQLRQVVSEVAKIKTHYHMPETIIIDAKHIDKLLAKTLYGKRVQDYVSISSRPLAWCLLESANDLRSYENSLSWVASDREHIKRIFSAEELKFCPCTQENYRGTILVEIKHHDRFSRYYLFNTKSEEMAKTNLDQGRFFVLKQAGKQVLKYDRRRMQLRTEVYLPDHLERALVLYLGATPLRKGTVALFDRIPPDVAEYVATKLQQSLQFGEIDV